ncbi:MAG: hypothetical protein ACOC84_02150 [Actinomycetota bacterium]
MTGLSAPALLEVLGTAVTTGGLGLLAGGLLLRCCYARWLTAEAVHVLEGGQHRLRWYTRTELHEEPWAPPAQPAPAAGEVVTVHYRAGHPERWALTAPYRHSWALLGAGTALTLTGLLLPLLS